MKERCYNCKYRQRERMPRPRLLCVLHEKVIEADDICNDYEYRYPAEKSN